jgi:uncharacterized integral membrane protein
VSTEERRQRTPWLLYGAVAALAIYALLFIVLNTHHVKVSFVLASTRVSLIFVIVLSLAVGFVLGVLGPRLRRHGQRRR